MVIQPSCFSLLFVSVLWVLGATHSSAQNYPTKPIRLVVSNSPASLPDVIARVMSPEMSKTLGQPLVVENRPSAGSILGYEYVAKQVAPDGYNLVSVLVAELAIMPLTVKELRFDPLRDLPPLIGVGEASLVIGSASRLPWKTFQELAANAKANPGKLNYGASSPNFRLLAESLVRELGVNVVYVPYTGGSSYFQGLLSGDVQMGFLPEAIAASFGDKFRVLAVTRAQRRAPYMNVPTFKELGFSKILGNTYSLNLPVGVPKAISDQLFAAASLALKQQGVRSGLEKVQLDIVELTPAMAAKDLAEKASIYADVAKKIGLLPE